MTTTDYIVIAFLLGNFFLGWRKGLFKSLLGPLSLGLCIYLGIRYFHNTKDIKAALMIGIVGPIVINFLLSGMFTLWQKAIGKEGKKPVSDRILGGTLGLAMGYLIIIVVFLSFAIIPAGFPKIDTVRTQVLNSQSFLLMTRPLKSRFPILSLVEKPIDIYEGSALLEEVTESDEYKDLIQDERIAEIFSDEATVKQIQDRNVAALLENPKVKVIFEDKELFLKFMQLNKKILEVHGSQVNKETDSK